ncbi:hypothetical protein QF037_009728 [Streptomyces canus]|nr:hypothetical protein [Streptomyces canus]
MFLSYDWGQGAVSRRRDGQRKGVKAICDAQVDYTLCV